MLFDIRDFSPVDVSPALSIPFHSGFVPLPSVCTVAVGKNQTNVTNMCFFPCKPFEEAFEPTLCGNKYNLCDYAKGTVSHKKRMFRGALL